MLAARMTIAVTTTLGYVLIFLSATIRFCVQSRRINKRRWYDTCLRHSLVSSAYPPAIGCGDRMRPVCRKRSWANRRLKVRGSIHRATPALPVRNAVSPECCYPHNHKNVIDTRRRRPIQYVWVTFVLSVNRRSHIGGPPHPPTEPTIRQNAICVQSIG